MNQQVEKYMEELEEMMVNNEELLERLNAVMKKEHKEASMEWVLVDGKPPFKTTDKWYIIDNKKMTKMEVTCSEFLNLYDVLGEDEITQEEYFRELEENTPILEKYEMTNRRIGENLPYVSECLYHEMSLKDKRAYDKLPNEVTIYRGAHMGEHPGHVGQAWTLDKDVAGFFAWSYYEEGILPRDSKYRVVLKAMIPKEYIFAYSSERSEDTCIVDELELENVEIYQEYSEENAKHTLNMYNKK